MSDDQRRECHELLAAVAAAYNTRPDAILSSDRRPLMFAPRCCLARVLSKRGYRDMEIARFLSRDHSTIVHALRRAEELPDCAAIADSITARSNEDLLLENAVRPLGTSDRSVVRAYLDSSLLARRRATANEQYRGLAVLSASPLVRQRCVAALELLGGGGHAWRMRYHAEQLGMKWRIE